jgi:hypothetical protein
MVYLFRTSPEYSSEIWGFHSGVAEEVTMSLQNIWDYATNDPLAHPKTLEFSEYNYDYLAYLLV